jgi:two-component system, NtrC family, response regulator AtoC
MVSKAATDEVVRVLALDDDITVLRPLKRLLATRGFEVTPFTMRDEAVTTLRSDPSGYDVFLLDRFLGPGIDGLDVLVEARQIAPDLPVVMLSGDDSGVTASAALKAGAFYYLQKPVEDMEVVSLTLLRATHYGRLQRRARTLEKQVELSDKFELMVGASPAIREVFATVAKVAETDVSVLIHGESGTGKELTARAIHNRSARARGPFIALNCGAIPETLIDSELFGHARGAFTGATEARSGVFSEAHGGTVFLDEIGEIPLTVQQRLLRVLQEHEVRPVGGTGSRKVDVRVIAATNVDLEEMVRQQRFRADLYYRLHVVAIRLPPLRERMDDLPLIAAHLLEKHAAKMKRPVPHFSGAAVEAMLLYGWPGNVRELENVIQRALALTSSAEIGLEALPPRVAMGGDEPVAAPRPGPNGVAPERAPSNGAPRPLVAEAAVGEQATWSDDQPFRKARDIALTDFERRYFTRLLRRTEGNLSEAARLAGLDRSNLRRALARLGMRPEDWRGAPR